MNQYFLIFSLLVSIPGAIVAMQEPVEKIPVQSQSGELLSILMGTQKFTKSTIYFMKLIDKSPDSEISPQLFQKRLKNELGFAGIVCNQEDKTCTLSMLFLHPENRRKGLGTCFLEKIFEVMSTYDFSSIEWSSRPFNLNQNEDLKTMYPKLTAFYKKFGAECMQNSKDYPDACEKFMFNFKRDASDK